MPKWTQTLPIEYTKLEKFTIFIIWPSIQYQLDKWHISILNGRDILLKKKIQLYQNNTYQPVPYCVIVSCLWVIVYCMLLFWSKLRIIETPLVSLGVWTLRIFQHLFVRFKGKPPMESPIGYVDYCYEASNQASINYATQFFIDLFPHILWA